MKALRLVFAILGMIPAIAMAQTYRCNVDGKIAYSQTRCADDAETVKIAPPPSDSLDNPDAAERYLLRKQFEAEKELAQQRLALEQQKLLAEQEMQRQQLQFQRELADKAQGIGVGATVGTRLNASQRREQQGALKALKAINGVPDIPESRPSQAVICTGSSFGSSGFRSGTTVCR